MQKVSDYVDFCGDTQLSFINMDENKLQKLLNDLSERPYYLDILTSFDKKLDQFEKLVCYAFSKDKLTREQVGTLLELKEMRLAYEEDDFENITCCDLLTAKDEFTGSAASMLSDLIPDLTSRERFLELLKTKPPSDRFYFEITIPESKLTERLSGFLEFLRNLRIINAVPYQDGEKKGYNITLLSFGARDAAAKAVYGVHAKKCLPRLGPFTKEDIERSMRKYSRYTAVSKATSFHGIVARTFYLSLHDEAHRTLVSSIPNHIYGMIFDAIDVVREKTGLAYSKQIWRNIDLEVDEFMSDSNESRNDLSEKAVTHNFQRLLSAKVSTEGTYIGLFSPHPSLNTLWVLLIDIVLNPEKYRQKFLNPEYFTGAYRYLYDFVYSHREQLEKIKSPAGQVATLKAIYFRQPYEGDTEIYFAKESKSNYIHLMKGGQPILQAGHVDFLNYIAKFNIVADKFGDLIALLESKVKFSNRVGEVLRLCQFSEFAFHAEALMQTFLDDKSLFKKIIRSEDDYLELKKSYPGMASALADGWKAYQALESAAFEGDKKACSELIETMQDLLDYDKKRPSSKIMQFILNDMDELKRLVKSDLDVFLLLHYVPEEYRDDLLAMFLKSKVKPVTFDDIMRLDKDYKNKVSAVRQKILMDFILHDSAEFRRIVSSQSLLSQLTEKFPDWKQALNAKYALLDHLGKVSYADQGSKSNVVTEVANDNSGFKFN